MRDGKGYLLPENPQPEGYQCLLLYIPDDPTGYYLAAMAGAFLDMGTWLAWEKDGTNRASLAAATWKDAIDYTFENGWLQCEDMNDKLDDILRQLEELNNMNINVNCGCGCGCGCKNGSNGLIGEDGLPISSPIPPVPSTTEPESPVGQWLCDASHQFVDDWLDFYANLFAAGLIGNATITAVVSVAAVATILTGGVAALLLLVTALTLAPAAVIADWVRDWLVENKDGLICAMSTAATPANAYNNVTDYLEAHKADQNGSFAGGWIALILKPVFQDTDWNLLFEEDSFPIDISNVGSSCPCEGTQFIDLLGDGTWYLVSASMGEVLTENNGTMVEGLGVFQWSGSGSGPEVTAEADFTQWLAEGRTWLGGGSPVAETSEHGGYVWVKQTATGDIYTFNASGGGMFGLSNTDYAASDVFGERQTDSDLSSIDFHAGVAALFPGLTYDDRTDITYDNANDHTITVTTDSGESASTVFRIYAVVKATALNIP